MSKLHVVIINDAGTARGGATALALQLVEALSGRGVRVTLLTGDKGPLLSDKKISKNVDFFALGGESIVDRKKINSIIGGVYNKSYCNLIKNWIEHNDNSNTVYHVHGWSKILSPSLFYALKSVEDRTVLHAHDYFLSCPNGGFMDYRKVSQCSRVPSSMSCVMTNCDKRSYLQKIWRLVRQIVLWRGLDIKSGEHEIVMIHEGMREKLMLAGWKKESMVEVKNPALAYSSDRVQCEKNKKYFFVGRLVEEKGVEDAIIACKQFGVDIEIIGDGELRLSLERKYKKGVVFHGWCSREEIAAKLKSAKAVLMTSRYPEPFGLVAAESSLSGIPVILPDSALLSNDIKEYGLGKVFSANNIDSIVQAIADIENMSCFEIKNMSMRAYSGKANISLSPVSWVDSLLGIYMARIAARKEA